MTSEMERQPAVHRYHRGWRKYGTHETILRLVPPQSRVLDVGCATGYLGETLRARGCMMSGCDLDGQSVAAAAQTYDYVFQADLDAIEELPCPTGAFDVLLTADVLEHLRDPSRALRMLRQYLTPTGLLIVSLPNVANATVRLPLLFGRFNYQPTGILDETHCRLYTFRTAREFVTSCGFHIERVLGASDRFGALLQRTPFRELLRGLLAYNIVILARPAT